MIKELILTGCLFMATSFLFAQSTIDDIINAKEVEMIEKTLSSDEMRGRRSFTPDIDKAADFIADEFKKIGLQMWDDSKIYREEFAVIRSTFINASVTFDGTLIDSKNLIAITCQPDLHIDEKSNYSFANIKKGEDLFSVASAFIRADKNVIVLVDTCFASNFSGLSFLQRSILKTDKNFLFVLGERVPFKICH